MLNVPKALAETHYSDLSSKGFFASLIEYITSGPVVAIALEGKNVDEQAIRAESRDGVILIHIPKHKVEQPQPRQIEIQ